MHMRQQEREFTVAEFSRLCNRKTPGRSYSVPYDSLEPFLDRCVRNGLLVKRQDEQIARYSPTPLLAYLFTGD